MKLFVHMAYLFVLLLPTTLSRCLQYAIDAQFTSPCTVDSFSSHPWETGISEIAATKINGKSNDYNFAVLSRG